MKIRMITFHTPKNYGAVLQAYSLMSHLKTLVEDVKIIDYNTPHLRQMYPLIRKPHSLRNLIATALMLPTIWEKKKKYDKFNAFLQENLNLTKRYESFAALQQENWQDVVFATGSDQVFNPSRIEDEIKSFYLTFAPENHFKFSYAASFGVHEIPKDKKACIAEYLDKFHMLSVRENSGVSIVNQLTGVAATEVLDPVFLNEKAFWLSAAKPYPKQYENYLFYYRLMASPASDQAARDLANEKGLKLVVMTEGLLRFRADAVLRDVGPEEFLHLLAHADFVVTDSFHGVAFSIILEKQFVFSDVSSGTNERGLNLLEKAGICETAYAKTYSAANKIDYETVRKKIDIFKNTSKTYLESAVAKAVSSRGESSYEN